MAGRTDRLSRSADFDRVVRRGRSAQSRLLVAYCFVTDSGSTDSVPDETRPRLGLTVSRAVGGAVVRNRTKRQLRAAFDAEVAALDLAGKACDIVLIARAGLPGVIEKQGFGWLSEQVAELVQAAVERTLARARQTSVAR